MRRSFGSLVVVCALAAQGCIIGTWPTPEGRSKGSTVPPDDTPLAPESCDGKDNDADGSIDEGCACDEVARGCVGREGGYCGLGVQWCVEGYWEECADIGPPFTLERPAEVRIVEVTPAVLTRGADEQLLVRVVPEPPCPGIAIQAVFLSLAAGTPAMTIHAAAADDGGPPDRFAADGEFAGELPNAFGPGVPAQALSLTAAAAIGGRDVTAVASVPLVEP